MLPASLAGAQLEQARSAPEQAAGARIGVHLGADAAQRLAAQPQRGAVLVVGGQADLVADVLPVLQVVGAERAKALRALVRTHRRLRGQSEPGPPLAARRPDEERAVAPVAVEDHEPLLAHLVWVGVKVRVRVRGRVKVRVGLRVRVRVRVGVGSAALTWPHVPACSGTSQ